MKRFLLAASLASSTCLLAAPSRAWDAGGHMIAARIALDRLSPEARARVEALVPLAPDLRPARAAKQPRPYDFVSLAAWMDDVRSSGQRDAYSTWHYVDAECGQNPADVPQQNALDALNLAGIVLRSDATPKVKAEWLAIAIHLIGDVHQPLHAIGRDRGGNDFWIRGAPAVEPSVTRAGKPVDRRKPRTGSNAGYFQKLHALWDSGYRVDAVKKGARREKVELYDLGTSQQPDQARIATVSAEIAAKYLPASLDITTDANAWVSESSRIACDWAFSTPRGGIVGVDYIARLHDTCCARLALSGVRMARWIEDNVR